MGRRDGTSTRTLRTGEVLLILVRKWTRVASRTLLVLVLVVVADTDTDSTYNIIPTRIM